MKPVSDAMINLILTQRRFNIAELYTFTFRTGIKNYFTDLDIPIVYGGQTYQANQLRLEGLKYKLAPGFQVDEQDLKITAFPGETLGGASFFSGVESGLLDGAYLTRARAFWFANTGIAWQDYKAPPIQVVTLFTGRVSVISKIGRTTVELKLKSPLSLLDTEMPRNFYSPGCIWTLYDTGCTINRASFTNSFTVLTATHQSVNPTGAVAPITGGDTLPYYAQGRLLFTSGVNTGIQVSIGSNDGVTFFLTYPLTTPPAPGDTFTASAGCSKKFETCESKFANRANFRGFPKVPPVVVSL